MSPHGLSPRPASASRPAGRARTGEGARAGQFLSLALFLVLLAFFIVLTSMSDFEEQRVSDTITSLNRSFTVRAPWLERLERGPGTGRIGTGALVARLERAVPAALALTPVLVPESGDRVEMALDSARLYDQPGQLSVAGMAMAENLAEALAPVTGPRPEGGARADLDIVAGHDGRAESSWRAVRQGGAMARSRPLTRRACWATAATAVAGGPLGAVLTGGSLSGALATGATLGAVPGMGTLALGSLEARIQRTQTPPADPPPGPGEAMPVFKRPADMAEMDARAVAAAARAAAGEPEMQRARAAWGEMNLGERKPAMRRIAEAVADSYPGVARPGLAYVHHRARRIETADGNSYKGVAKGMYVPVDGRDAPPVARLAFGADFFAPRILVNASSDAMRGSLEEMVEIIAHETTHHAQRQLGRTALMEMQAAGKEKDGGGHAGPGFPRQLDGSRKLWAHWYRDTLQKIRMAGREDDTTARGGRPMQRMRDYLAREVEAHAFANGAVARQLTRYLNSRPAADRAAALAQTEAIAARVMGEIEVFPHWNGQRSVQGYRCPTLTGARVITGTEDAAFDALFDAARAAPAPRPATDNAAPARPASQRPNPGHPRSPDRFRSNGPGAAPPASPPGL